MTAGPEIPDRRTSHILGFFRSLIYETITGFVSLNIRILGITWTGQLYNLLQKVTEGLVIKSKGVSYEV